MILSYFSSYSDDSYILSFHSNMKMKMLTMKVQQVATVLTVYLLQYFWVSNVYFLAIAAVMMTTLTLTSCSLDIL